MFMTGVLLLKLLCSQYNICDENTQVSTNNNKAQDIVYLDMSKPDKPESEFPEISMKGSL